MNRMNVNFFICENLLLFFHFVLFGGFFLVSFFSSVWRESDGCRGGCGGALTVSGSEVTARATPGSRSLAHSVCLTCFFSFQNSDPYVEPAIEDSEN